MAVQMERYGNLAPTPESRAYFDKITPPVTKIALCSIGQFAMHLLAYGLLLGILGAGACAATGVFGNIDMIYRVIAGGGAAFIFAAGGGFTKYILPNLSGRLDQKVEKAKTELEVILNEKP